MASPAQGESRLLNLPNEIIGLIVSKLGMESPPLADEDNFTIIPRSWVSQTCLFDVCLTCTALNREATRVLYETPFLSRRPGSHRANHGMVVVDFLRTMVENPGLRYSVKHIRCFFDILSPGLSTRPSHFKDWSLKNLNPDELALLRERVIEPPTLQVPDLPDPLQEALAVTLILTRDLQGLSLIPYLNRHQAEPFFAQALGRAAEIYQDKGGILPKLRTVEIICHDKSKDQSRLSIHERFFTMGPNIRRVVCTLSKLARWPVHAEDILIENCNLTDQTFEGIFESRRLETCKLSSIRCRPTSAAGLYRERDDDDDDDDDLGGPTPIACFDFLRTLVLTTICPSGTGGFLHHHLVPRLRLFTALRALTINTWTLFPSAGPFDFDGDGSQAVDYFPRPLVSLLPDCLEDLTLYEGWMQGHGHASHRHLGALDTDVVSIPSIWAFRNPSQAYRRYNQALNSFLGRYAAAVAFSRARPMAGGPRNLRLLTFYAHPERVGEGILGPEDGETEDDFIARDPLALLGVDDLEQEFADAGVEFVYGFRFDGGFE